MQVSIIIPPTGFNRRVDLIRAWLDQSAPQSCNMTLEGSRLTVIFFSIDLARAFANRWCDGYAIISPQIRRAHHEPPAHAESAANLGDLSLAPSL